MNIPGYDAVVTCPYNRSHQILQSRIQYHLIKCKRSNPDIHLVICPFDTTHHIRQEDKELHMSECTSREAFDRYMYQSSQPVEKPKAIQPKVEAKPKPSDDDEESWDHYNLPTYDPQAYAASAYVLRQPRGLNPSQRRKFADDERKRLSALERGDDPNRK